MAAEHPACKSWEITIANPTEKDLEWVKNVECSSIYIAKEIAESGLIHLQGRIVFKRGYRLPGLKKLHPTAYWDRTKAEQDWNYYKKLESEPVVDNIKRPRQRSDLEGIKKKLKVTNSIKSIVHDTDNYNNIKMCQAILTYDEPQRPVGPIEVYWFWGGTGLGKTKEVYNRHQLDQIFRPINYKWWDGYDGHKIVLFDDFRKDFCKFHELLTLLDIYPYRVECKGGSRQIQANKFYITSAFGPAELYDGREDIEQLLRRVTEEWKFTALGPVVIKAPPLQVEVEDTQLID
jgi:hypothetical protein